MMTNPELQQKEPKLWAIVNGPDTWLRERRMRRAEREVREQMGVDADAEIDWSNVDWAKVFQWVAAIVSILLLIL